MVELKFKRFFFFYFNFRNEKEPKYRRVYLFAVVESMTSLSQNVNKQMNFLK